MPFHITGDLAGFHAVLVAATSTTSKKSTSSSGSSILLILLVLLVGGYLWLRPQRKRMRSQQAAQRQVDVGDEVVTTAGIIGRVVEFAGNRAQIEIAPGTTIEVLRSAIVRRAEPNEVQEPDESSAAEGSWPGPDGSTRSEASDAWPGTDGSTGNEPTPGGAP